MDARLRKKLIIADTALLSIVVGALLVRIVTASSTSPPQQPEEETNAETSNTSTPKGPTQPPADETPNLNPPPPPPIVPDTSSNNRSTIWFGVFLVLVFLQVVLYLGLQSRPEEPVLPLMIEYGAGGVDRRTFEQSFLVPPRAKFRTGGGMVPLDSSLPDTIYVPPPPKKKMESIGSRSTEYGLEYLFREPSPYVPPPPKKKMESIGSRSTEYGLEYLFREPSPLLSGPKVEPKVEPKVRPRVVVPPPLALSPEPDLLSTPPLRQQRLVSREEGETDWTDPLSLKGGMITFVALVHASLVVYVASSTAESIHARWAEPAYSTLESRKKYLEDANAEPARFSTYLLWICVYAIFSLSAMYYTLGQRVSRSVQSQYVQSLMFTLGIFVVILFFLAIPFKHGL
jgi:hypothetical protein